MAYEAAKKPLFRKLDNYLLHVSDLDEAISFYRDRLGHALIWRDAEAAGFALPETDAERSSSRIGPETDILVDDVDAAFRELWQRAERQWNRRSTSRSGDAPVYVTLRQRACNIGSIEGNVHHGRGAECYRRRARALSNLNVDIPPCRDLPNVCKRAGPRRSSPSREDALGRVPSVGFNPLGSPPARLHCHSW